jgi:hypothetical protein
MSALGQKQTLGNVWMMSAIPPKADIAERDQDVRFVPIADIALLCSIGGAGVLFGQFRSAQWRHALR